MNNHAYLSPSKPSWIEAKGGEILDGYRTYMAIQKGNDLHRIAKELIEIGLYLDEKRLDTIAYFAKYVNACIYIGMTPELQLYYNEYCYGTADAIKYDDKEDVLYVFDLKTGITPPNPKQLIVYATIFCKEYNILPLKYKLIYFTPSGNVEVYCDNTIIKNIQKRIEDMSNLLMGV